MTKYLFAEERFDIRRNHLYRLSGVNTFMALAQVVLGKA